MSGVAVHWFRKGLRVHDNPALLASICNNGSESLEFCPVFILDSNIKQNLKVGPNRWRFLQQSLADLDKNLRKIGSRLLVVRGKPEDVFPLLFRDWNVKLLTFEMDTEPYAKKRDELVENIANKAGVKVIKEVSHTLYDPRIVLNANSGNAPLTYQKFLSVVESIGSPPKPKNAPLHLPPDCMLKSLKIEETEYCVPSLTELGIIDDLGPCIYPGGETEALNRLEKCLKKKSWVCKFEKPKTSPNSLEPSTTVLSPYLKFGCLSSRVFYYKLNEILKNTSHTKPPVSLIGQLMWREFYYVVGFITPNFDKMEGNPICCQVPWQSNQKYLEAWTQAKTGYPFIDAIMSQLRQEGWIHHLARHAVACFLTRGDLWISWEEGQKVFEELLLDADWALNAGNWMWLSASAFFHQFFRVYSPVAFGKKTDKLGNYIRKYVPQLRKFPPEYIYEPWKAPLSVQKQAGCLVGQDYPQRIVIHEEVYKINIAKMSEAYKNMKGDSENAKRLSTPKVKAVKNKLPRTRKS